MELPLETKLIYLVCASIFIPYFAAAATLIITVLYAFINKETRNNIIKDKSSYLVFAFSLFMLVVPLIKQNYFGALAGLYFYCACLFVLFVRCYMTARMFQTIMKIFAVGSVLATIWAVFQLGGDVITSLKHQYADFRPYSVFYNPNYYGYISASMIIIGALVLVEKHWKATKELYVLLACNLFGLVISGCRSAIPALICGLLVIFMFKKQYKLVVLMSFSLILGIIIIMMTPSLLPRFLKLTQDFTTRFNILVASSDSIFKNTLFGQGLFTGKHIGIVVGEIKAMHAHNMYIDSLMNFGVVGSLLILAYLIIGYRKSIINFKKGINPGINAIIFAFTVMTMIHGFFDIPFLSVQTGAFASIFIGSLGLKQDTES